MKLPGRSIVLMLGDRCRSLSNVLDELLGLVRLVLGVLGDEAMKKHSMKKHPVIVSSLQAWPSFTFLNDYLRMSKMLAPDSTFIVLRRPPCGSKIWAMKLTVGHWEVDLLDGLYHG